MPSDRVELEPQLTDCCLRLGNNDDQRGPTALHSRPGYEAPDHLTRAQGSSRRGGELYNWTHVGAIVTVQA